jgi:hypothetical protein
LLNGEILLARNRARGKHSGENENHEDQEIQAIRAHKPPSRAIKGEMRLRAASYVGKENESTTRTVDIFQRKCAASCLEEHASFTACAAAFK